MSPRTPRKPLSRERVLNAGLALADEGGFESLTMRTLAKQCGVEAMSLYNHVANKEDLLDGLIELVFAEIEPPVPGDGDWKAAMRARALSVRTALNRHRWAIGRMEGRMTPGPASLRAHEAMMGTLREGGFEFRAAVHASSALDAYTYGFMLQERDLPFEQPEETAEVMAIQRERAPAMDQYPYLLEVAGHMQEAGYDFAEEFEFGLDLILDGLERYRTGGGSTL